VSASFYRRGERRRALDCGPARGARARALRTAPGSATSGKGGSAADADAAGVRAFTTADRNFRKRLRKNWPRNGFEVEPMGPKSVAIQAVPAGVAANDAEHLLTEIIDGIERENAAISIDTLQAKIAASTACHAAIKVNMAAGSNQDGMAAGSVGKDGLPDELPARKTGGTAILGPRN